MKKVIAILCVICMLFSVMPQIVVFAASTEGISIAVDPNTSSYAAENYMMSETLPDTPRTFEALIHVPTSYTSSAGIIIGNHQPSDTARVNLYAYSNGNPRFLYRSKCGSNLRRR